MLSTAEPLGAICSGWRLPLTMLAGGRKSKLWATEGEPRAGQCTAVERNGWNSSVRVGEIPRRAPGAPLERQETVRKPDGTAAPFSRAPRFAHASLCCKVVFLYHGRECCLWTFSLSTSEVAQSPFLGAAAWWRYVWGDLCPLLRRRGPPLMTCHPERPSSVCSVPVLWLRPCMPCGTFVLPLWDVAATPDGLGPGACPSGPCYGLRGYGLLKFTCWNANARRDGVRRWGLWSWFELDEVMGVGPPSMGLAPL